jgi:gas vesicle protein
MRHSHSITDNPGQLLGVTSLAAAVGAVTAMLFTPRSGQQLRAGLRRRAAHMREDMMHPQDTEVSKDLQKTMQDAKTRLSETASKAANDTKSTAKKVTEDTKNTSQEAKDAADRAKRS